MQALLMYVIFLMIMGIVLVASFIICKNQWLKAIVIILIKIAEKYINTTDGSIKMNFVKKIVLYIYQTIFKAFKLAIPDEKNIEEYCQKIYDNIASQLKKIKTSEVITTNTEVNKIVKELTKE